MFLTDKKSIIFRGKIFNSKEKIFKLTNNNSNNNNLLYCFGGENYFLVLNNNDNNNNSSIYTEIKNPNNNIINNYKKIKLFNNSENKVQKNYIMKGSPYYQVIQNHFNKEAFSLQLKIINIKRYLFKRLNFSIIKKEQNKALITNNDISENTLTELSSYISILGISFSSTYNDSNLSFRPTNLPPISKKEENFHK